jgi:hypothetical protein
VISTMPAPVVVYTGAETPPVEPGDLWRSLRNGFLLFAVVSNGEVLFLLPDASDITIRDAAAKWAPLERLIHGPEALTFESPAALVPLEPARFYDALTGGLPPQAVQPGVWHGALTAHDQPDAADDPDEEPPADHSVIIQPAAATEEPES